MKRTQISFAILLTFLVIGTISCNKDDDEYLSMTGSLKFDLSSFSFGGVTYDLSFDGITVPEGVEYYWVMSWNSDTLYGKSATITLPDEIGKHTIISNATHEDYVRTTNYQYVTVIDTTFGVSLAGLSKGEGNFTDPRDNKKYSYVTIGDLQWFTANLNWDGEGLPAQSSEILALLYGRYYSWNEATGGVKGDGLAGGPQGVCPPGWSIPTNEDWENLAKVLNGGKELLFLDQWSNIGEKLTTEAYFNGDRLWTYSPNNLHRDEVGWNSVPLGAYIDSEKDENYLGYQEYAFYWSASEKDEESAYYRYIYFDQAFFNYNCIEKDGFRASVRCVRRKYGKKLKIES